MQFQLQLQENVQAHLQGWYQIMSQLWPRPQLQAQGCPRGLATEWRSRRAVCLPWSSGHGHGSNELVFRFFHQKQVVVQSCLIIDLFCSYCSCSVKPLSNQFTNSGRVRIITNEMIFSETGQKWVSCLGYVGVMLGHAEAMLSYVEAMFSAFLLLCFSACLLFCFSASVLFLLSFLLPCFFVLCFPCFAAFLLLCFSTSTCSFSAVMCIHDISNEDKQWQTYANHSHMSCFYLAGFRTRIDLCKHL